jgi:hypothetical protein
MRLTGSFTGKVLQKRSFVHLMGWETLSGLRKRGQLKRQRLPSKEICNLRLGISADNKLANFIKGPDGRESKKPGSPPESRDNSSSPEGLRERRIHDGDENSNGSNHSHIHHRVAQESVLEHGHETSFDHPNMRNL